MMTDLLPRGNVREFEAWLIREVVDKKRHQDYLKSAGKDTGSSWWLAVGDLSATVNALAHYTDREPGELHKVADSARELRRVIHEGHSWAKENKAQVKRALAGQGE